MNEAEVQKGGFEKQAPIEKKMENLEQELRTPVDYDPNVGDKNIFTTSERTGYSYPDVSKMTPEQYAEMEKDIETRDWEGEGFTVYGWNDASGYEYWKKESEEGNFNVIRVSAIIQNPDIVDPKKLDEGFRVMSDSFQQYDHATMFPEKEEPGEKRGVGGGFEYRFKGKKQQIEALVQFLNDVDESEEEYMKSDDYGETHLGYAFENFDLDDWLEGDTADDDDELIPIIKIARKRGVSDDDIVVALEKTSDNQVDSYYTLYRELVRWPVEEEEVYLEDRPGKINGKPVDDLLEALIDGLSEEEKKEAGSQAMLYWSGEDTYATGGLGGGAFWIAQVNVRDLQKELKISDKELEKFMEQEEEGSERDEREEQEKERRTRRGRPVTKGATKSGPKGIIPGGKKESIDPVYDSVQEGFEMDEERVIMSLPMEGEMKSKTEDRDFWNDFEDVSFFGLPLQEDEYRDASSVKEYDTRTKDRDKNLKKGYTAMSDHMKPGGGPGKVSSKSGTEYGEKPGGSSAMSGIKSKDSDIDSLKRGALKQNYKGNEGTMDSKTSLDRPHGKEGQEYDEGGLPDSKVKTPKKVGDYAHMKESRMRRIRESRNRKIKEACGGTHMGSKKKTPEEKAKEKKLLGMKKESAGPKAYLARTLSDLREKSEGPLRKESIERVLSRFPHRCFTDQAFIGEMMEKGVFDEQSLKIMGAKLFEAYNSFRGIRKGITEGKGKALSDEMKKKLKEKMKKGA